MRGEWLAAAGRLAGGKWALLLTTRPPLLRQIQFVRPKRWIGNAAEDGRAATVFARLKVPAADGECLLSSSHIHTLHPTDPSSSNPTNQPTPAPPKKTGRGKLTDHGVHAFIVPLRDESGRVLPGVEIHDCGYKVCVWGGDFCGWVWGRLVCMHSRV